MGKRDKTLKLAPPIPSIVHGITSDDDDDKEANEDLSLNIVAKSLLQACNPTAVPVSLSESPEVEGSGDVAAKTRTKVKKTKKVKKKPEETVEVVGAKDEVNADISQAVENAEVDPVEKSDSLVLRKLLRGPRYFDPPGSGSGWGECYNCGEQGHTAANCTSAKRMKPCFICGSLEHQAKQCTKGKDCYICKKGGHRAKDCPENGRGVSKVWKICLRCGESGHHDMFSCNNDYPAEDLKAIRCYICKSFGHLCCVDFIDTCPIELSCYRCGRLGHGGLDCGKSQTEKNYVGTPGKCYKCQEVGHKVKNCPGSTKDSIQTRSEKANFQSPGKCHRCGEGHVARDCPSSTKDSIQTRSEKANVRSPGKCHGCGEAGHVARDCPSSTKDGGELRRNICFTCGKEGHFAKECLRLNEVEKRKPELSTPTLKFSKEKVEFKKAKSSTSEVFMAHKRKNAEFEEDRTPTTFSSKKRGGWITEDPTNLSSRETQVHQWDSPMTPTYNRSMAYSSGVNGHDFCSDDTRYGYTVRYKHGPLDQPRDQYGHGPSSEPYRQYRHTPSEESYHHYRHAPSRPYHQYGYSNRPNHQYVVCPSDLPHFSYADAPNGASPSVRVGHPHNPHLPSPSNEAARAHHQTYLSGSFQPRNSTTRFNNSSSDGMQRLRRQNR